MRKGIPLTTPFDQNTPNTTQPDASDGTSAPPTTPTPTPPNAIDHSYRMQPAQLFQAIHDQLTTGVTFTLDDQNAQDGTFAFHSFDGARFSLSILTQGTAECTVRVIPTNDEGNRHTSEFFDALDERLGIRPAAGTHGGRGAARAAIAKRNHGKLALVSLIVAVFYLLLMISGPETWASLIVFTVISAACAAFAVYGTRRDGKSKGRILSLVAAALTVVGLVVGMVHVVSGKTDVEAEEEEEEPRQCVAYTWPDSEVAALIPQPEAATGEIISDSSDFLSIELCGVDDDQFNAYIDSVRESGFTVDYNRTDDSYFADNEDGYYVNIGRADDDDTVMTLVIRTPYEDSEDDETTDEEPQTDDQKSDQSDDQQPAESDQSDAATDDFTAAMDSYEELMNEYVDFMIKYEDAGEPTSMLTDYLSILDTYTEAMSKLDAVDEDSLTTDQLQYYLEVTNRVNQRLLEIAE